MVRPRDSELETVAQSASGSTLSLGLIGQRLIASTLILTKLGQPDKRSPTFFPTFLKPRTLLNPCPGPRRFVPFAPNRIPGRTAPGRRGPAPHQGCRRRYRTG